MKSRTGKVLWIVLAVTLLVMLTAKVWSRRSSPPEKRPPVQGQLVYSSHSRLAQNYGNLPLSFELNQGQTDGQVKFLSRGSGYTLFLTQGEALLSLRSGQSSVDRRRLPTAMEYGPRIADALFPPLIQNAKSQIQDSPALSSRNPAPAVVRMKLVGANLNAKVEGLDPLPGKSNYFTGSDPKKWRTNVPNYTKVKYKDIYPGIDLVYFGNQGRVEHDFVVRPGADPSAIAFEIVGAGPRARPNGADGQPQGVAPTGTNTGLPLRIDPSGDLVISAGAGEVRFPKPVVYQPMASANSPFTIHHSELVNGRFVMLASNRIGFEVGAYEQRRPLVIDPVLEYSTFLGGSDQDIADAIAVDSSGNAYVAGTTSSLDFPTSPGAYQSSGGSGWDNFVAKLNPAGSALEYSTYFGGGIYGEIAGAIAVSSSGEAYVAGYTFNADFPTTAGAFQMVLAGESDAFVTKLNATGSALAYSTYLGGSGYDQDAFGIALDAAGNAYVTGLTGSVDFPTTPDAYDRTCGSDGNCNEDQYGGMPPDAFVVKLNPTGSALVYSTYLGGSRGENSPYARPSIAVDASGNAIVSGDTSSADFPTTAGALDTTCGTDGACNADYLTDTFVAKLNVSGTALLYSTYLGGGDYDEIQGLALDSAGNLFLTGMTFSADFPTTQGAFDRACGGCIDLADGFVAKLNPTASALVYSTYLGGSDGDGASGISVDSQGDAYVTGVTYSDDFPLASPLKPTIDAYMWDIFMTKLNSTGSGLLFSTYLGGDNEDISTGIGLDSAENAYITGVTASYGVNGDFPTTPGAFQTSPPGGGMDAFVAKISTYVAGPSVSLYPTSLTFAGQLVGTTSAALTVTLTSNGDTTLSITDIAISGAGDFDETDNCELTLAAGANCTINVTFTPTQAGNRMGTLSVSSDAPGSPHTVALSGTGTDFTLTVSPTSRTITAGQSATFTLSVNPVAGFNQTVALSCTTPTQMNQATCRVLPSAVTLDGTNAATATVTVTTTARAMAPPLVRQAPPNGWARLTVPLLVFMSLVLLGAAALRRRRACQALAGVLLCVTLWAACGGGRERRGGQTGTQAGTYTLTLTGTVGGLSLQGTATLTVN